MRGCYDNVVPQYGQTMARSELSAGVKGDSGRTIRNLAEAYAWIVSPAEPHGGSSDPRPS